ncbi:cation:proton antiporter [Candidatus Woesearchaeota archaeon]|nr:cation:proton antiporter [Candidatus Woesearchaeota archaeon]
MNSIFFDVGIIIILATVGGFLAKALKQPLISSYIIMGVILGPVLHFVADMTLVEVLSDIGIAFLLFIVGVELDVKRLKDIGAIATGGALLQMVLSFLLGFGVFRLLHFSQMQAVFAGIILMFSSTMVVIKLLVDKSQLETLHGRIVVGTLLMQDVIAVMLLSVLSRSGDFSIGGLVFSLFLGALVFGIAWFFSKVLFPQLFRFAARSQELFFLLSISVCFLFALAFEYVGLSIAIGGFVAGLMLGNLPYNLEIISKVKNLRDFFATIFFVSMGIRLSFDTLSQYTLPFIVLLGLTIFVLPFLTFLVTLFFGYNRRVAFLTAVSLSQVSEFALIAVHVGIGAGHIEDGFFSLTIMVALASIMATSYLVKYEDKIYKLLLPFLKRLDRAVHVNKKLMHHAPHKQHDVVLIGYDRTGYTILKSLRKLKRDVIVVDFNPDIVGSLIERKIPCLYGDIGDDEVLEELHLEGVGLIISTVPSHQDTMLLIKRVREVNKSAKIIVTAYVVDEALSLYEVGADYVIVPHLLGGKHAGVLLEDVHNDIDSLIKTKLTHIGELKAHTARHRKQLSKKTR